MSNKHFNSHHSAFNLQNEVCNLLWTLSAANFDKEDVELHGEERVGFILFAF
jgi:hypothetical protein